MIISKWHFSTCGKITLVANPEVQNKNQQQMIYKSRKTRENQ